MTLLLTISNSARLPDSRRGPATADALGPAPIILAATLLLTGISVSVSTTADPLWWHLHFSRLGMFDDFSGRVFNATLTTVGGVIALSAKPLGAQLRRAVEAGIVRRASAATAVPVSVAALGVSLSGAGLIPLSLSEFLHERAANGMLVAYSALLFLMGRMLTGLPRRIRLVTGISAPVLAVATLATAAGIINLALLEAIMFTLVLASIAILSHTVDRCLVGSEAPEGADASAPRPDETPAVRRAAAARRMRRRALLPVGGGIRSSALAARGLHRPSSLHLSMAAHRAPSRRGDPRGAARGPSSWVRPARVSAARRRARRVAQRT